MAATVDTSAWYGLVDRGSKAVKVAGLSIADGAAVVQYGDRNGPDRHWQLIRVE